MVFSSIMFLFIYLPIVLGLNYITPRKYRNVTLLIVSLAFYGWGEPLYIFIMIFTILIDYVHGILIGKHRENPRKAKMLVASSIVINLGILVFFKYYDFIVTGIGAAIPTLSFLKPLGISLPIGISFYTFQAMSYTIDVYRGDARPQRSLVNFGTYVTLFPQLIAGPIVQYKDVDLQLDTRRESVEQFASGVQIFICGLAKKVILANNIGALWEIYKAMPAGSVSTLGAWLGAIAFAFQIYFDFSGYSDMAIGLGRMLGFEFKINFNYPYISRSISEFWRRWHISLGSWFREYVYIPLGGNRRGSARTYCNLFAVWALTGLWHGASWNFLAWGVYFAILIIAERAFLLKWLDKAPKAVAHAYTLVLVLISWVLFAANDIGSAFSYLGSMFGAGAGAYDMASVYNLLQYLPMIILCAIASLPIAAKKLGTLSNKKRSVFLLGACAVALIICTGYLVDASYNPFLYFRF